ncbi:unnamed protein product [Gemmata massiliana]|uniref:Uncharacterized protein n=1 Tax=Gemmata massiliana TaxID=1210884 RepID=A0A6P2DM45_9BACT|nr:TIGR02996 domain-containing protein [Gemmata massiliana]VTS03608.1 unnamed protein product [Gemmata massiliana]
MSERAALLAAIRNQLDGDTPRLVFADWLDERAESDRDTATAEFIRASCEKRNHASGLMPRKAYRWIAEHWHRLVPLTLGLHVPKWYANTPAAEERQRDYEWYRSGRTIELAMVMHVKPDDGAVNWYRVDLEFNRGFVQWFEVFEPEVFERVRDALKVDQPLAKIRSIPIRAPG